MSKALHIIKIPVADTFNHCYLDPDAIFLSCQAQGNIPCLWFLAPKEPDKQAQQRSFTRYETGEKIHNKPGAFLGTCQLFDGTYVVHIFEEGEKRINE